MENSLAVPQKVKHRIAIGASHSIPRDLPKRIENRDSNRQLNLGGSLQHYSYKLKGGINPSVPQQMNG